MTMALVHIGDWLCSALVFVAWVTKNSPETANFVFSLLFFKNQKYITGNNGRLGMAGGGGGGEGGKREASPTYSSMKVCFNY